MAFNLTTIAVFSIASFFYAILIPPRFRSWMLLIFSIIAIYWLQPRLNIRYLDFVLPSATLLLTIFSWRVTRPTGISPRPEDRLTAIIVLMVIVALSFMRFVEADFRLTPSRPPEPFAVALVLVVIAVMSLLILRIVPQRQLLWLGILVVVFLLVILKTEPLAASLGRFLRAQTGQDVTLARTLDLNWLGFSYVAFRLLHTFRDRQQGLLPTLTLREYLTYVIFFPAFVAGPIDRAERFLDDLRILPTKLGLDVSRFSKGTTRIMVGLFKKFVIADTLAQGMALDTVNAAQITSTLGCWLLLYGFALRLFFDFSGYSDIAIGVGILFGFKLPENFDRPYIKCDIAAFWQSWHITLSQWVRFYVFSPLSRRLLTRQPKPSPSLIVFATQVSTMLIIGMWHGISGNFIIWGAWHGLGLFIHKQWSDRTRKWYLHMKQHRPRQHRLWTLFTWFVTFHFVVIGWVWFVLPDVSMALRVLGSLFGLRV